MLSNRLSKRVKHLRKWAKRVGTDAFRIYDRDIPEIPLLIELYADTATGALYARPYEKDDAEEERWLCAMTEAASGALNIPIESIFLKQRKKQKGLDQYERIAEKQRLVDVREGGLLFRVNVSDYLDTGLFLDHRKTRDLVRAASSGKRVLNLFCYTASFSVYAASGGAAEIDSIDLSNTYLDWAAENFALNGFETVRASPLETDAHRRINGRFRLIRADVIRFLAGAANSGLRWDLIVLDPPTFSNSKKMEGTLDVRRDFQALIDSCLAVLSPNGTLWFSTNARGFSLNHDDFPAVSVEDVGKKTLDEDFLGHTPRACYIIKK
ncbi:MAG: class I SAM-dependent methyltransferase [Treponemataceae bacterium]